MSGVNQDGLTCLVSYHFFIVSMKESLVRRFIWFMFISVFSEEWRQTETNKQLNNSTNINDKTHFMDGDKPTPPSRGRVRTGSMR